MAPYTGSAIGQHWMYQGKHVLIVFDDLSKQAEAYRAVSLLLRRPPGREAYPGDVFYLHSRLLERCAKLSDALGGGSMTGLPIIETKANDVSAYIPTNVISITDARSSAVRPVQRESASRRRRGYFRVPCRWCRPAQGDEEGRRYAQAHARAVPLDGRLRDVRLRPGCGDPSSADPRRAPHGAAQAAQSTPYAMEDQVASIWMGTNGYLDDIEVEDVLRFERGLLDHLHANSTVLDTIAETGDLSKETEEALKKAVEEFHRQWISAGRGAASAEDGEVVAERTREEISRGRTNEKA